ncbi:uncharacterized protein LOC135368202 isoform X2 [Ornithodoros turicata]|uniref:uncharacterized protein LOC135368202 isoform X2 n=1 Tax=Ornithodoros turicata TaxID=34597 RepID=UPI003139CA00
MPVQAPQWTEFLSCPICYRGFEGSVRRPVSLGCGHTLCTHCLAKLQRRQCPFDQSPIAGPHPLPENSALLRLVGAGGSNTLSAPQGLAPHERSCYMRAVCYIEELALFLKPGSQGGGLSRPMQRKLVTLVHCQLAEAEGRARAARAARSLGDRSATELLLQHQNGQQLSAHLWAAVRARGCQFLGPAMQEEVLRLVLLALEDGSALSRKVLVLFVVQRLAPHFPQASKTSIGHVVQLLYRASCFKVSKREGDSSLMQLKEEFRTYEALRREHDAQIVQIATEAGLRIAPEQWSSLLYGDTAHKSHMQSIIDKLQTPQSFAQSVQELVIALQRTGDPGNLSVLRPHFELLASIDPSPDASAPSWEELSKAVEAAATVVQGLAEFLGSFGTRGGRLHHEERPGPGPKYKTSLCRDLAQRGSCPRGPNCTFAHSQEEMDRYRAKSKRSLSGHRGGMQSPNFSKCQEVPHLGMPGINQNHHVYHPGDTGSAEGIYISDASCRGILSPLGTHGLNPDSPAFQPSPPAFPVALPLAIQLPPSHTDSKSFFTVSHSEQIKKVQKNQNIASQSLAELQQRKKEIIAKLGSCDNVRVEEKELEGFPSPQYSPWTSSSFFKYKAPSGSMSSSTISTVSSTNVQSSAETSPSDGSSNDCEDHSTRRGPHCPSEEDPLVPFGPPLVSKYGPISRSARAFVRGPAPIQVNAISQMGQLTSPTSSVRHPVPSASPAPSLYALGGQGFAVPLAIFPPVADQLIPLGAVVEGAAPAVVLPIKAPHPHAPLALGEVAFAEPWPSPVMSNGKSDEDTLRERLEQELRLVEQSIEHREKIIAQCEDDFDELAASPKIRQQQQQRAVPTSIGPWSLSHLEQDGDKYEDGIDAIERHWLQELEKDEENIWKQDNSSQDGSDQKEPAISST